MYILGIDFGTKKLGLAILEPTSGVVSQLPKMLNDRELFSKIAKILTDYRITKVVLGKPSYENTLKKVEKFAKALQEKFAVETHFTTEDNTSIVTKKLITSKKQQENLDSMSAVEILTQWHTDNMK